MRLLCLLPCVPLPADTGGRLRTLHLLRALDERFDVTALALASPSDDVLGFERMMRGRCAIVRPRHGKAAELESFVRGEPLRYARYAAPEVRQALLGLLDNEPFDAVHFDHLHMAQLLPLVRERQPRAKLVIDEHNVEARVASRLAEISALPLSMILNLQARRVARLERTLTPQADVVLACSDLDAQALRASGARRTEVIPNGVSLEGLIPSGRAPRSDVVLVGSLDWRPNAEAAIELAKSIWPRIAPETGDSHLVLVGRNPPPSVRALASDRVVVTGTVRSVAGYLHNAWATAIPLRAGSGTRLKILEACAARVPVVCTRLASEGLPLVHDIHLLHAETADEFATALLRLYRDPGLRERLAEQAFTAAAAYEWSASGNKLVALYERELGVRPSVDEPGAAVP